jgi:hypothetical protein
MVETGSVLGAEFAGEKCCFRLLPPSFQELR